MATFTTTFTADGSGSTLSFVPVGGVGSLTLDNVSVKEVLQDAIDGNEAVKEFLTGNTDDDREIHFRADTQIIQLMTEFETLANPIAIVSKLQRGSLVKCFIALGDDDFYELEGNATKGVSIVKVHNRDKNTMESPPIAREVRLSWRDSSMQLCRLTQGSIVFFPTTMSYSE